MTPALLRARLESALGDRFPAALSPGERRRLIKLILKRQQLARRKRLLDRSQKVLYYWHLFHVPFVILMFLILLIHVYVSLRMGNKWIL